MIYVKFFDCGSATSVVFELIQRYSDTRDILYLRSLYQLLERVVRQDDPVFYREVCQILDQNDESLFYGRITTDVMEMIQDYETFNNSNNPFRLFSMYSELD